MAYSSETEFYQYTVLFYVQSIYLKFFEMLGRVYKGRKALVFGPNAVIVAPTCV